MVVLQPSRLLTRSLIVMQFDQRHTALIFECSTLYSVQSKAFVSRVSDCRRRLKSPILAVMFHTAQLIVSLPLMHVYSVV